MAMILHAMITGVVSGAFGAAFSWTLEWVTSLHQRNPAWIWGLPLVGGLLYGLHKRFIKQIDEEGLLRLSWIFGSGSISHLVGASVGREGAIVKMSTTLSHWIADRSRSKNSITPDLARSLGQAGGFAAAIGNPWAGSFFAWEHGSSLRGKDALSLLICAVTGALTMGVLGASTLGFPPLPRVTGFWTPFLAAVLMGLIGGGIGRLFAHWKHRSEKPSRWMRESAVRGWIGGLILLLLLAPETMQRYRGLGIETIGESFTGTVSFEVPILKLVLTVLSLASGFTGGEFIPLVFIGAATGNVLNQWIPLESTLLPAMGCAVVFGAAARLPITALVLSCVWSGWALAPWAALAHGVAAIVTIGAPSLYGKTYWTSKRKPER
jgi:H+/Cl- antiporter ClcA